MKAKIRFIENKKWDALLYPVPQEQEVEGQIIQEAINNVLKELDDQNINRASVTPFLLKRVNKIADGMSSEYNIVLIRNNALVGPYRL